MGRQASWHGHLMKHDAGTGGTFPTRDDSSADTILSGADRFKGSALLRFTTSSGALLRPSTNGRDMPKQVGVDIEVKFALTVVRPAVRFSDVVNVQPVKAYPASRRWEERRNVRAGPAKKGI